MKKYLVRIKSKMVTNDGDFALYEEVSREGLIGTIESWVDGTDYTRVEDTEELEYIKYSEGGRTLEEIKYVDTEPGF